MAKNKNPEPEQPSKDEVLKKRVDAMMDPAKPDPKPELKPVIEAAPTPTPTPAPTPKLDIFEGVRTAPEVSPELLKQLGDSAKPAAATKPAAPIPVTPPVASNTPQLVRNRPTPAVPIKPKPADPLEPAPATPVGAQDEPAEKTLLDDPETDKAVEDITVHEADELLAVADAVVQKKQAVAAPTKRSWKEKPAALLKTKRLWLLIVILLVAATCAVPASRYKLLGLVLKRPVTVAVLDATTARPVSGAEVSLDGKTAKTNASGQATFSLAPGPDKISISKQYYQSYNKPGFVGVRGSSTFKINLVATGRQVPLTVLNKISGRPISGATINILNTSAKTDSAGQAFIVLPTGHTLDSATISASGYNLGKVNVQVTSDHVAANNFLLVPTGTVYFLSNLSGTLDVVKTNLDGSDRHTVVAGTGREDAQTTSLLATRDWRYLVLEARRDSGLPALYLIDGKTDKLTKIDSTNASYQLIGWYGHDFVYDIVNNSMSRWQSGRETLKSYNADNDNLANLDQDQATGSASSYAYQSFENFYLLDNLVTYNVQWFTYDASGTPYNLSNKPASVRGVTPDNQNKKDYQTFDSTGLSYIQATLFQPQGIYYDTYNSTTNKTTFYQFDGQKVSPSTTIDQTTFNKNYPTYLFSPSGKNTLWRDLRDGKNALFVGDASGATPKQIASLTSYAPYGWYGDNYLLVSKNNSELYIMPVNGLTGTQQPLKLTNYYKPAQTLTGYGYGYGGL